MDYKHYGGSTKKNRMEDEVDCEGEHGHGHHGRQVDSGVEVAGAAINTAAIIVEQGDDAEDLDDFFASLE